MLSDRLLTPVNQPIPLCVPDVSGNEWQYVKECLDTAWVSSVGAYVDRFEQLIAERVGCRHAVATVNGTAALHTALLVAGVEPDDEVLVSALSFIAPANAVRYAGAWPVFIDAEENFWQMDPQCVAEFLKCQCEAINGILYNRQTRRRVRAIIPVHILGHSVDLTPILELAKRFNLVVIEDATEGLGANYAGQPLGSIGDIGCYSFNGNKMITTGGGGMLVTNREDWAEKARYLTTQAKDDPIEYVHGAVGFNYRLTNIQAAMGCAQLEQLDRYLEVKKKIAADYSAKLMAVHGITPMPELGYGDSAWWLYTMLVDAEKFGIDRKTLQQQLAENKIQSRPLWQPLHQSPAYSGSQFVGRGVAEKLNSKALSLPCSVGLKEGQLEQVVKSIGACCRG